jgi:hypothetical protein
VVFAKAALWGPKPMVSHGVRSESQSVKGVEAEGLSGERWVSEWVTAKMVKADDESATEVTVRQ